VNRFGILLNHYLLISLTLAFITGIILQQTFPFVPLPLIIFFILLLLPTLFYFNKNKSKKFTLVLLLSVVFLGFLHAANFANQTFKETNIFTRITQEEDAVLTGTLYRMPLFDGKKSTVIIKSRYLRLQHEEYFSSIHGLIQLRLKDSWPPFLLPGDELVIRTRLSRPYRFGNPGGFDYPAFLDAKNIRIVGRISSPAHIHALDQEPSWRHSLSYFPERIRLSLKNTINTIFPTQQAGMYRALLIGDRSGLSKKQLESFKASGVFHILAISGLHLSLVASALFVIFYWLARRSQYLMLRLSCKKLALLTTIPLLFGYALLAGAQTPVLRSLIMVVVFILSFCVQRRRSPFTTLSFAALLILLINPKTLFTVSFQLSFAAVASLILILPRLISIVQPGDAPNDNKPRHFFRVVTHWITAAVLLSIAATIGTAPLLINSFNRISTVGPVANLALEPLLCLWSLPMGLLSVPILFISPHLGEWLLQIGGFGITAAMAIADFLAGLQFSTLWLPTPSLALILLYYITLASCFFCFSHKRSLALFITVCGLFFFSPRSFLERYSTESELVFLDVGQGSSTLLSFPGGQKVLIDGGGSSSGKFNVGESIIAPYLWYKGITHLNAVIITHPDSDHFNGIPFILRRFKPDTLWINGNDGHGQEYDDLLSLADDLNIEIKKPVKNQVLMTAHGAVLQNITNPFLDTKNNFPADIGVSSNEESLILQFTGVTQKLSCLFPGDISQRVEEELIKNDSKNTLHSSFLLSPHHGSKTSNSPLFLNRVNPEQIVVSAGSFRPLLFPSPRLRSYCEEKDIPLLNTSKIGAITIRTDGDKVEIYHFNQVSDPTKPITL
jgi:competence protein ComEC